MTDEKKPYNDDRIRGIVVDIDDIRCERRTDIMDAILIYAQQTGMEVEVLGDIVKSSDLLLGRMRNYSEDNKLVEVTDRLEFE